MNKKEIHEYMQKVAAAIITFEHMHKDDPDVNAAKKALDKCMEKEDAAREEFHKMRTATRESTLAKQNLIKGKGDFPKDLKLTAEEIRAKLSE